jgi:hypothetical protein
MYAMDYIATTPTVITLTHITTLDVCVVTAELVAVKLLVIAVDMPRVVSALKLVDAKCVLVIILM